MFVTLVHGIYDDRTGEMVLASGGHPRPLLRHADGSVEELAMPVGRLLGCFETDPGAIEYRLTIGRGETLALYSDGYVEAAAPRTKQMLGLGPLKGVLAATPAEVPLAECAERARQVVERVTGGGELQDDLTLLLLRRR
jgi:serine phosphatase RsbU (regulator of sigma subunit)